MTAMIKAIIFDCFGVLTADTWKAFLDSLPENIDKQAARDVNKAYDGGHITKAQFMQQLFDITGTAPDLLERRLDTDIAKNEPLLEYIRELKSGYKIGLLSNIANSWITDVFLSEEEQALFDDMVFSFKAGMTKPDLRIFLLACKNLGVEPTEAIMVDDISFFCDAARQAGLEAVNYQNLEQTKLDIQKLLS